MELLEQDKSPYQGNKGLQEMQGELLGKLKPLVSSHRQWQHFSNYVGLEIEMQRRTLEQATDITAVHRAQGAINALHKIVNLRDHVNGSK